MRADLTVSDHPSNDAIRLALSGRPAATYARQTVRAAATYAPRSASTCATGLIAQLRSLQFRVQRCYESAPAEVADQHHVVAGAEYGGAARLDADAL
jgi:hypothetical protein